MPVAQSLAALAAFRGIKRRLEVRGTHQTASPCTTISRIIRPRSRQRSPRCAATSAANASSPSLEPRSNTMKLGTMKARCRRASAQADRVYCYAANLGWDAAAVLAPLGDRARVASDLDRLIDAIVRDARPGDHVLVMSNGGFGGIHGKLLARLARRLMRHAVSPPATPPDPRRHRRAEKKALSGGAVLFPGGMRAARASPRLRPRPASETPPIAITALTIPALSASLARSRTND